jgi:hypothetical protein
MTEWSLEYLKTSQGNVMQNYFDTLKPPLFAAGFDYFRIPREKWPLMLTRLAQLGVSCLTLDIPWGFHEFEQGAIDLTGATNPRRDIVGFIELCARLNFFCLLKLGPTHLDRGILNDGLPLWISNSEANESAPGWFQALSKGLVNRQWPAGPIIALHVDDQLAQQQPRYSQEITEVRWPIWLRKRYKGIEALNEAYSSSYRSVSNVPFPQSWSQEPTALETDARQFLAEIQEGVQNKTQQTLLGAGWQIPLFPFDVEPHQLPAWLEQLATDQLPAPATRAIIDLQNLIQVDPDPGDIGRGPAWAGGAPIRADGSLRRTFWRVRQLVWANTLDHFRHDNNLLLLSFKNGGLASAGQDLPLKLKPAKGSKPSAYRLYLNGEIHPAEDVNLTRANLTGPHRTEDETGQIDLIFYLNKSTIPAAGFLETYLKNLLRGQIVTLAQCARLAANLSQSLKPESSKAKPAAAQAVPYAIAEARRGLSEADRILRKAMASIGGLEAGFEVMLSKSSRDIPAPAEPPPAISPEIFEGRAKDILVETSRVCADITSALTSAAEAAQQIIDAPGGLPLDQYRQTYSEVVAAAHQTRRQLLDVIADLRLEIVSETLPLVAWRLHHQIQEIAESLRWGVLRG